MIAQMFSQILNKGFQKVGQAAFVLAVFTVIVSLFGLIRDRLLAGIIGPSVELDIYNAAFLIPDLVFAVGASLVSVTILMPFLAQRSNDGDDETVPQFIDSVFTTFFGGIVLVSAVIFILMPFLAPLVAPGFDAEAIEKLITLSRIMLLSPILLGLSNLLGTITQLHKKFLVFGLSPVLYNIGIIIGVWLLYPIWGATGLALGVILGALMHMGIQVPVTMRLGVLPRFTRRVDWQAIRDVVLISLPRTLTLSFNQITLVVLYALASSLIEGSISILRFAISMHAVPVSIIGMSYSVAAFPTLVDLFARERRSEFINALVEPARKIVFWSLQVMALFIVLRAQIVRVVLGTGQFDWNDTRLVAAGLAVLVISVAARGLINLFVRGYYAAGYTYIPLVVNALSSVIVIASAYLLLFVFRTVPRFAELLASVLRVEEVAGASVILLALAYSLGALINALILWKYMKRRVVATRTHLRSRSIYQSLFGSVIMGVIAYMGLQIFDPLFSQDTILGVFGHGFSAGILAIIFVILVMVVIGNREYRDLAYSIRSFIRTRIKPYFLK